MKLSILLDYCNNHLLSNKIESYKLDSILIISHYLKLTKEKIIFNPDLEVNSKQTSNIKKLIERRSKKEPLSHIIESRDFFEDSFIVNKNVLDPRPDSEVLIESVLEIFQDKLAKLEILELGVGSGCLVLSILNKYINASATGVDINRKSLEVANLNAKKLNLTKRIKYILSDWFSEIKKAKFDLIISNPPYIKNSDINNLQDEVRYFEPRVALDGGLDGLDCYRIIAKDAKLFLKKSGYLVLEIGYDQEKEVKNIFSEHNYKLILQKKDLSGIVRCLIFTSEENEDF